MWILYSTTHSTSRNNTFVMVKLKKQEPHFEEIIYVNLLVTVVVYSASIPCFIICLQ